MCLFSNQFLPSDLLITQLEVISHPLQGYLKLPPPQKKSQPEELGIQFLLLLYKGLCPIVGHLISE